MDAGLRAEQRREAVFADGEFRQPAAGGTLDVRETPATFGGTGQSGQSGQGGQGGQGGRSGGGASIEEFTERRWLTVNTEPAHYP